MKSCHDYTTLPLRANWSREWAKLAKSLITLIFKYFEISQPSRVCVKRKCAFYLKWKQNKHCAFTPSDDQRPNLRLGDFTFWDWGKTDFYFILFSKRICFFRHGRRHSGKVRVDVEIRSGDEFRMDTSSLISCHRNICSRHKIASQDDLLNREILWLH